MGRLDVFALVIDSTVGYDGADYGVGCDFYVAGALDQALERGPKIAAATIPEASGMSMAVDGLAVSYSVILGDIHGAAPAQEFFFDLGAMGMAANDAGALVAIKAGFASSSPRRGSGALPIFNFVGHKFRTRVAQNWDFFSPQTFFSTR
ncbi:MAG: hypothetical protein WA734_20965 [Candidatus Acidiferrales bacterium]